MHNDFVTHEGSTTPIRRDMAKYQMLNFIPFAGPWREMADGDGEACLIRQALQCDLPQPTPTRITAPSISRNQQLVGLCIGGHTHLVPPTAQGLNRKLGRIMIGANTDPVRVGSLIIN